MIGVINLNEFKRLLSSWGVKVISSIEMSWSLIFEVDVYFNVCGEIILLSPEDCYRLVIECFVCLGGCHSGNSSVFQELVEKPNLC